MSHERMWVKTERLKRENSGETVYVVVASLHPHESSAVTSVLMDKRIDGAKAVDALFHCYGYSMDDDDGGDGGDGAGRSYSEGAHPLVRPEKQHWLRG